MAIAKIPSYSLPAVHELPEARAPWDFEPPRAALLVHDLQDYFLAPFGDESPLLDSVLRNVEELIVSCRALGVPVIFSAQPGEQSRRERGLLWDLWGPGIISSPGTEGFPKQIQPRAEDIILHKKRYSAFHDTELEAQLAQRGRTQLLITGVYGHIGCLATATDGFMRGIEPFLVADAIADFSEHDHQTALRQVARTCGVVTHTEALLGWLKYSATGAAAAGQVEARCHTS